MLVTKTLDFTNPQQKTTIKVDMTDYKLGEGGFGKVYFGFAESDPS